jgi:Fe-S-cluster-containing hydrogenase component 2
MITVNKNRCPQNHKCPAIRVCPVNAISQKDFELPIVDNNICVECKKCIKFCPMGAIHEI